MARFFVDNLNSNTVNITGQDCAHISRVLRKTVGDTLTLCDGSGSESQCKIVDITEQAVTCEVLDVVPSKSEASCKITLYMALCKGSKLSDIIDRSTQLGVTNIVLFYSKFCTAKPDSKSDAKKNVRYQKIAAEAAKQSGRGVIPTVHMPLSYDEMLESTAKHELSLLFYEHSNTSLTKPLLKNASNIGIIIGSEGGFAEDEVEKAIKAGCHSLSLGPRILRCETAPVTAISIVMNLTGNM